jgi:Holliday junction DNA helicase RuvA
MIAKLIGVLDSIFEDYVILNVGGVGYRVFCSSKTIAKLPPVNHTVTLFIETQVREDHIHLFGFADATEQQTFNLITTVQGVGARVGLSILSALSPKEIQMAVMTADSKAFTRANGVGPKLGVRLTVELKGKMGSLGSNENMTVLQSAAKSGDTSAMDDAISALVNLGYSRTEAGLCVARILNAHPAAKAAELIRLALKEIGSSTFKNEGSA